LGTHFKGPVTSTNGLIVGSSGTTITKFLKGTVSVVVATDAAAAEEDVTLTISGAAAGDSVILNPPNAAAEAGLSIALVWVSAADTVKVRLSNLNDAAALAGSTSNWSYLIVKS
jgi:hypothetical protein